MVQTNMLEKEFKKHYLSSTFNPINFNSIDNIHDLTQMRYKHNLAVWICHCSKLNITYINNQKSQYKCVACKNKNSIAPSFILRGMGEMQILEKKRKRKKSRHIFKKIISDTKNKISRNIGFLAERKLLSNLKQKYQFIYKVEEKLDYLHSHLKNPKIIKLLHSNPKTIDFVFIQDNEFNFIEVKTGKSKLSRHQRILLHALIQEGYNCWLYYSKNGCDKWKKIYLNKHNFMDGHILRNIQDDIESNKCIDEQIDLLSEHTIKERTIHHLNSKIKYWQYLIKEGKCKSFAHKKLEELFQEWRMRFGITNNLIKLYQDIK